MKLHHIAFWTTNVSRLVTFYSHHFSGHVLSEHTDGDFRSVFMQISGEARLEIMSKPDLEARECKDSVGHSHISFELDSKTAVDELSQAFKEANVELEKECVQYEDGFYESAVFDPDGNIIEFAFIDRTSHIEGM